MHNLNVFLYKFVLSVFWNLVYAVGIGLLLACLFFMKKMGDLAKNNSKVGLVSNEKEFEINISEKSKGNVFIKHLNGPLFFGFTSEFVSIANKIPKTASVIIIDMEKVPYIDQSGLFALEDVIM